MYEFDTFFPDVTGDLTHSYTGSGVHLYGDVTFNFSLLDQQQNSIINDYQLINNSLVNVVAFDILDTGANVIYANYKSGTTSRSLTLSKSENESIFGYYQKDFGVRAKITDNIDNSVFASDFFAYANVPLLSGATISDGSPPTYSYGVWLSGQQSFDKIVVDLTLSNSLKYINIDRYDIYASTGNDISLYVSPYSKISDHPNYLFSQQVDKISDINTIVIKPTNLTYNTNYYFTIVPYSSVGSGYAFSFGPSYFASELTGNNDYIISANKFIATRGSKTSDISLITGTTVSPSSIIDSILSGQYFTINYLAQFISGTTPISYQVQWQPGPLGGLITGRIGATAINSFTTGSQIISGSTYYTLSATCDAGFAYALHRTAL